MKVPTVYIVASQCRGTLYIGVTSSLAQRMQQHTHGLVHGFSKKYAIKNLVFYEMFATMEQAIAREKQLKHWNRAWKLRLVEEMNPEWKNLFDAATGEIAFGPADAERLAIEPVHPCDLDGSPPSRG
ncbi:MAG: GIY-YIG nuclease family protein [Hyphomicrobium sp.]|nr:GIY-YIG nuclease family protein [Hyphomicrobium sp.]